MYPRLAPRTAIRWMLQVLALASAVLLPGLGHAQPFAYVTENTAGNIARIDLANGNVIRAAICSSPQGVAINKAGSRGYVACGSGGGVQEFDAATLAPTLTYATCSGDTYDVVLHPTQPRMFASCGTTFGTVHGIPLDGSTQEVVALDPGATSPKGLSVDPAGTFLLAADSVNGVYAMDLTFPLIPVLVRPGQPFDVKFNGFNGSTYQVAYPASGVVETLTFPATVVATATNLAGLGPAYIASNASGTLAVGTVNFGGVYHCTSSCSGSYFNVSPVRGLAYTRDESRLLVSRNTGGEVLALDGVTEAVVATYTGFTGPWGIATGPVPVAVTINKAIGQADPTGVASIAFTVVFSEPVTGFDAADILFTGSTAGGSFGAVVTGSGANYTVTVSGMTSDGNVVASVRAFAATSIATGIASFTSTSTDNTVSYDATAPTVTINQGATQADPTNVPSVVFDIVFSEPVTGFTASDISFAGSALQGGSLTPNITGTGPAYTLTVTGMTAGNHTVIASIPAGQVTDAVGRANVASTSTDNTVAVDNLRPSVAIIQAVGQADPTAASPINFQATFPEAVTGFATGDVTLGGTALPTTATVTGGPAVYNIAVSGMTAVGTVTVSLAAGVAQDAVGNTSFASTNLDNTVTYAPTALTVTINQAAGQSDPTNQSPVRYTITFSAPVTGFDPGDISFTGSTVGGTLSRLLTGSGANYTLIVAGMTSSGNVVASIPAGVATNGVITNSASTSTDNTVAYTYVTPGPPFAYVTNTSSNNVSVVSMTGLVTVATIPACVGASGIALNPAATRAYVACTSAGTVSVIDLTTSTVAATIPVGGTPIGLVMNAAGTRVYVVSLTTNSVAVIDTSTNTVTAAIPVVAGTRFTIALSESANKLYVPNGAAGSVTVINVATNTVIATVPAVGTTPVAVSMNPTGTRAYVSDQTGDQIVVIDTATDTVAGTIALGAGTTPLDAIVSPSGATLYTANHGVDGVGVVNTTTNTLTTTIPLNFNANARGMAMTPTGNQLWVVDQQLNGVTLIDPATNAVVARVPVGSQPLYIALGPPLQPTVTLDQAVAQADPTLVSPINFTVTFSEAVTGFAAGDVAFTGSTAAGTLAAVVTGGPTTYNVAVSGMTSAGTVVASIPAGGAGGASGTNLASTSTDNSVTFAPVAPSATINQAGAQADPTAAGPINFTVTFSEAVTGFVGTDVQFTGSTVAGTLAALVTGGPTTFNVAVSGMTSPGTVVASVPAAAAIGNVFGLPNVAATSTDNSVTFTPSAPTVTINQAVAQADPTYAAPVNFTVVFSAAVTGFAANDLQFTGSTAAGTLSAVVTGGPTTFNVAVSGMTSTGTVVASIPAGAATLVGVGNIASTSADNSVLVVLPVTVFTGTTATGTGTQSVSFSGGGPACTFAVRQLIGAPPGAAPIPPIAPPGVVFPHGLFDFTNTDCTQGSTLVYTLTYPAALQPGTVYWKYGPTAANTAPHWYTLPATIVGNTITFSITDGGLGDDDLTANGAIVDQGGPGVPGSPGTATAIPTLSEWMLMLLALMMIGVAGGHAVRRR